MVGEYKFKLPATFIGFAFVSWC